MGLYFLMNSTRERGIAVLEIYFVYWCAFRSVWSSGRFLATCL